MNESGVALMSTIPAGALEAAYWICQDSRPRLGDECDSRLINTPNGHGF